MIKVSNDQYENYSILEHAIQENNLDGTEVLQLFANYFGLQLFSYDATVSMLQEIGEDVQDDEDEEDFEE
jgi:hypothetical protein